MELQKPKELGYRMPAEWEPHERTWMGWPERPDNWREDAKPAQKAFVDVATAIAQFETVTVCANTLQVEAALAALPDEIGVIALPQDDAWFRDTGPTFVVRNGAENDITRVAGVDWQFNAWGGATGGLYPDWNRDKEVASRILERIAAPRFPCPLILEGGSIHVDGEGTLLTTEECLLNPNRNPNATREEIEGWLKTMLGVEKIIWLPLGLFGDDDTNGHIDNLACFARPGVVLLSWTDDESNPQYSRSQEALKILMASTDARGRKLEVIKIPLPPYSAMVRSEEDVRTVVHVEGVVGRQEGERLAGSYVNLYICNGGVVMPGLGHEEADAAALAAVTAAFPERKVVQVQAREILLGGGNIHCITQQQPAMPASE